MSPHADPSNPDPDPTAGVAPDQRPDFLTVEEAASLLRIGRTSAYALTQQWRHTGGQEGLPVVRVGRLLRVPRHALERLAGGDLGRVPVPGVRVPAPRPPAPRPAGRSANARPDDEPTPGARARTPNVATSRSRARRRHAPSPQASLFGDAR